MIKYLADLLFSWTTKPILLFNFWDIVTILLEIAFITAIIYMAKYKRQNKKERKLYEIKRYKNKRGV